MRLSIGQRKRVALATVLAMNPSILVFDEPSAGLDPRGRRELIELLQSLTQTLIVSTHDLELHGANDQAFISSWNLPQFVGHQAAYGVEFFCRIFSAKLFIKLFNIGERFDAPATLVSSTPRASLNLTLEALL
jgi:hypothetical protein